MAQFFSDHRNRYQENPVFLPHSALAVTPKKQLNARLRQVPLRVKPQLPRWILCQVLLWLQPQTWLLLSVSLMRVRVQQGTAGWILCWEHLPSTQDLPTLTCFVFQNQYQSPLVSIQCWHVHCEKCWFHTLGAKKLCPQCNMITSPSDLRRIFLWSWKCS